jgi:hypothetical protein
MEIAGEIAAGRSNKDVSREFSICERTVKHHLTNIFKKLGVSSRLELAVLIREQITPNAAAPVMRAARGKSGLHSLRPERSQLYLVTEP